MRTCLATTLALALAACGGGGHGSSPTVPPAGSPPPIAAAPTEPLLSASCQRLPLGSAQYTCKDETANFYDEVVDAIASLQSEHPEYFRGNTIVNGGGYYVGLIRILDRKGLCAAFDGQELAVKSSNAFSDQYRVQTSWGEIKRIYMGTCYPAVFPLARANPPASPAGCPLAPSVEVACDRIEPRFSSDVEAAIDQLLQQRPELFDPSQAAGGSPLVRDLAAYHAAMIEALVARGYCGRFDGEEIQIKRSNEFTEHYDVNYADRYVRRGSGAYRGSCYPAAF